MSNKVQAVLIIISFLTLPVFLLGTAENSSSFKQPEVLDITYIQENSLVGCSGVLTGIEAQLWGMARKYNLDYDRFLGLAICESTLDPDAEGKAGEIGIFQFLPSTFSYYAKEYNKVGFSIHDTNHQINLAGQMISNGKESEWTCVY